MRLYRKEKHWSDYWEVDVNFPWIGSHHSYNGKRGWVAPDEPYYAYGFSFPTKCFLHREDEFFWYFTLRILGFGMTITRQNGY
jgi:hypothetical protein